MPFKGRLKNESIENKNLLGISSLSAPRDSISGTNKAMLAASIITNDNKILIK